MHVCINKQCGQTKVFHTKLCPLCGQTGVKLQPDLQPGLVIIDQEPPIHFGRTTYGLDWEVEV